MDFAVPADYRVKMKRKTSTETLLENEKKLWNMKMMVIPTGTLQLIPKGLMRGGWTGRVGNRRTSKDHPNYSIIEINQNTGKRTFAVTQTSVKDHQLMRKSSMVSSIPIKYKWFSNGSIWPIDETLTGWLVESYCMSTLCRLFNAKSIFMQIVSSTSNNTV